MIEEGYGAAQIATGIAFGLASVAFAINKSLRMWATDRQERVRADAGTDIVEQLRAEVRRLAEQNDKLATLVNKLQLELAEVRGENAELRAMLARFEDRQLVNIVDSPAKNGGA